MIKIPKVHIPDPSVLGGYYWAKTNRDTNDIVQSVKEHSDMVVHAGCYIIEKFLPPNLKKLIPHHYAVDLASHDVGKISPGFQSKHKPTAMKLGLSSEEALFFEQNHALLGELTLDEIQDTLNFPSVNSKMIGKHHGSRQDPKTIIGSSSPQGGGVLWHNERVAFVEAAKREWGSKIRDILGDDNCVEISEPYVSGFLAGLMVLSDWIASSCSEVITDIEESKANMFKKIDILFERKEIIKNLDFGDIFFNNGHPMAPNNLQSLAHIIKDIDFEIMLVESGMGSGKTEMAIFTYYLITTLMGEDKGFFYALPTITTSNVAFNRVQKYIDNMNGIETTIRLIHGKANLLVDTNLSSGDPHLNSEIERFFSDNRKKLLDKFCIGTVDQILLPFVNSYHNNIRYFALCNKIIIIDELHSYDDYMSGLIMEAINRLTKMGCKFIILSATLSDKTKQKFLGTNSFDSSYPVVTTTSRKNDKVNLSFYKTDADKTNKYILNVISDHNKYVKKIIDCAEKGRRAIVYCNSVKRAQHMFDLLSLEIKNQTEMGLMHAQYIELHRVNNESEWISKFGDKNKPMNGQILVATQVAEQSLNLDSDELFTDLCPMDILLQRIGRCHRYKKSYRSYLPNVWVFVPPVFSYYKNLKQMKNECKQYKFPLKIYPLFFMVATLNILVKEKEINVPTDIRRLINAMVEYTPINDVEADLKKIDDAKTKRLIDSALIALKDPLHHDIEGEIATSRIREEKTYKCIIVESMDIFDDKLKLKFMDGTEVCLSNPSSNKTNRLQNRAAMKSIANNSFSYSRSLNGLKMAKDLCGWTDEIFFENDVIFIRNRIDGSLKNDCKDTNFVYSFKKGMICKNG